MRKLTVQHVTRYVYQRPIRSMVQSLRLRPSINDAQDVIQWEINSPDGEFGARFTDAGGDRLTTLSIKGPVENISISVSGLVETEDTAGVLKGHRERMPPIAYLSSSLQTAADDAVRELAVKASSVDEPLERAHELSRLVGQAIRYQAGETNARTTAIQAMNQGTGVCQDQAQVLIAAARESGMPARYVSGYLLVDADGNTHDASHAWAEIHIKGLGWVGFDVANHCCPDDRYIRLGSGMDALEAAPIRGAANGLGEHELEVEVSVREVS